MFPKAAKLMKNTCVSKHVKNISCTLFQKQSHIDIFSDAAARSLKTIEMFSEAATHSLKSKRYIQKQQHKFFTVSAQNIRTLCEDFQNLSMAMKISLTVIKPQALHFP